MAVPSAQAVGEARAPRAPRAPRLQAAAHIVACPAQRLPITKDTLRLRREREDLENQICDVEDAIKLFSRPKVYVREDA